MEILDYIHKQDSNLQPIYLTIYNCLKEVLPDVKEKISFGMPTFYEDTNLIHFACMKKHIGIYPGSEAIEYFQSEIEERGYRYSKGAIQIPYTEEIPKKFLQDIAVWCRKAYKKS